MLLKCSLITGKQRQCDLQKDFMENTTLPCIYSEKLIVFKLVSELQRNELWKCGQSHVVLVKSHEDEWYWALNAVVFGQWWTGNTPRPINLKYNYQLIITVPMNNTGSVTKLDFCYKYQSIKCNKSVMYQPYSRSSESLTQTDGVNLLLSLFSVQEQLGAP